MSERMVPYHCPYCGNEDLRPHVPDEGSLRGERVPEPLVAAR